MAQLTADMLEDLETVFTDSREDKNGTEISLREMSGVLLAKKRLIVGVSLAAATLAAAFASLIPPTYKAEATVLPPQQQQSSLAALSGALGGFASSGMASSFGLKNPADLYVGILRSRTIADALVDRFQLQHVYRKHLASETRKALSQHASFAAGKDSLITIDVEDESPQRAADLANAFVSELYNQNSRLAITEASQSRMFFEQELAKEKDALAAAEVALKNTQQSTGLLAPAGQAEILLRSGAQLRAEIASREVQLQAMRSYATDENAQVQVLKKEVGALQGQLAQLEAQTGSGHEVSAGSLPQSSLEYLRRARDLKYHETLYELLAKQYEAARIDEAKRGPVLQVVDRAVVPDQKNGPHRLTITFTALAGALVLTSALVIVAHGMRSRKHSPATELALA